MIMNNIKSWESLYEKYSSLFEHRKDRSIPLKYGIECDIGWYDILSSLCFLIAQRENNNEWSNKNRIKENREPIPYESVKFIQIKQKFGGLRVYFDGGNDYIRGLVHMAEGLSYKICEKCGEKGTLRKNNGYGFQVLCEKCNNEIRSQDSETNNK